MRSSIRVEKKRATFEEIINHPRAIAAADPIISDLFTFRRRGLTV